MSGKPLHAAEHLLLVALLRQLRQRAGMTQHELAGRLGRPQSFVSKFENGQRRLDLVELRAICRALETDLPSLVRRFDRQAESAPAHTTARERQRAGTLGP